MNQDRRSTTLPVKDPRLLQHVAQVDVGVQEVWVEGHGLLKVVDGQPDLALSVEDTPQVAPGHGKVWSGLDGLEVARLHSREEAGRRSVVAQGSLRVALHARLVRRCLTLACELTVLPGLMGARTPIREIAS